MKHYARFAVSITMIEAYLAEALVLAGSLWVAVTLRRRTSTPTATIAREIAALPHRLRPQARAIVAIAREHLTRHADGSIEAYTARETLRSYLPETIAAYLSVPPALRASRRGGSRSPDEELVRQFSVLRAGLERLRENDAQAGSERMAENAAFLGERFGPATVSSSPARMPLSLIGELVALFRAYVGRV